MPGRGGNAYVRRDLHLETSRRPRGRTTRATTDSYDVFVARLNAAGNTLLYATYFGGAMGLCQVRHRGCDGVGDGRGKDLIVSSSNFPATAGAYDTSNNGVQDGFVARLNAAGSGLST